MGLADADRGRFGQHTTFGLIGGFRHAVDAVGQMDQRHLFQPRHRPFRHRVQSVMQLEHANRTDGLTGVYNRRYWQQQLQLELLRAERYQHPVSLLLFDLDKFKQLNDSYGHQGGDAVLTTVAERISALLRDTDIFGRYGGEEFGVVLPETALDGALMVANRICKTIAAETVSYNQQHIPVTLSIGVASFAGQSSDELIQQADIALYNAKRQGRNCVCAYTDSADYLKKIK